MTILQSRVLAFVLATAALCACELSLEGKDACESDADCVDGNTCIAQQCTSDRRELPLLPVLPDPERIDACTQCAAEQCSDARESCLEDDDCMDLLECKGACSDPACLLACVSRYGYSPWYDDYWGCVLNESCTAPCARGENFACVDEYEAPKAKESRFSLRLRFKNPRTGLAYAYADEQRDEEFALGARANSCLLPEEDCISSQRIDTGVIDRTNSVELGAVVDPFVRHYTGMLEVEHRTPPDEGLFHQLGWRDRYLLPFFTEDIEFRLYVFWRGWVRDKVFEQLGTFVDFDTAAPLAMYFEDCIGTPARGVRFEFPAAPEVPVLHQTTIRGDVSLEATDIGSAIVDGLPLGDVAEGQPSRAIRVRAVDAASGRTLAQRNVHIRPGWLTHAWLMPSTR